MIKAIRMVWNTAYPFMEMERESCLNRFTIADLTDSLK